MDESAQTVSELGEDGLVRLIAARIGPAPEGEIWTGDDAAVVGSPGPRLLLTTDQMVEGVDFDLAYTSGDDLGWKVVAVNVSDVAAMGGEPHVAVATAALPTSATVAFVDAFVGGLMGAAREWGVNLVGGDLSRAGKIVVSVALVGAVEGEPVRRDGARPGDVLCVTGELGGSAAGLHALRGGDTSSDLAIRHLRPRARLDEARALVPSRPSAMIDVSDGLAVDLGRLTEASGVGCDVDIGVLPIAPGVTAIGELAPEEVAVLGGEDYELLFTIAPERLGTATEAVRSVGTSVTAIGRVTDGPRRIGGRDLEGWRDRGWDHLRGR